MGPDITKLALKAARAAMKEPERRPVKQAPAKRKRRGVRAHLPPAWPLLTGAAIAIAGRGALRSRGAEWLHTLGDRLEGDGQAAPDDEDRAPDLDETAELQYAGDEGPDEPAPDDADDADEEDEEDVEAEADDTTSERDAADGPERRRPIATVAPPSQMSPVRRRKLAQSTARAG